jgi:hypothetical protein
MKIEPIDAHAWFGSENLRKRAFGRPKHSWSDYIKIYHKQVWENLEWIHLADNEDNWRSVVNAAMNPRVL